jgi:hypothetical protein
MFRACSPIIRSVRKLRTVTPAASKCFAPQPPALRSQQTAQNTYTTGLVFWRSWWWPNTPETCRASPTATINIHNSCIKLVFFHTLNFHDYEIFVPRKMGKTVTQHNYSYIFEKKSIERVINERTRRCWPQCLLLLLLKKKEKSLDACTLLCDTPHL